MLAVAADAKRSIRTMVPAMAHVGLATHTWKAYAVELQDRRVSDENRLLATLMVDDALGKRHKYYFIQSVEYLYKIFDPSCHP